MNRSWTWKLIGLIIISMFLFSMCDDEPKTPMTPIEDLSFRNNTPYQDFVLDKLVNNYMARYGESVVDVLPEYQEEYGEHMHFKYVGYWEYSLPDSVTLSFDESADFDLTYIMQVTHPYVHITEVTAALNIVFIRFSGYGRFITDNQWDLYRQGGYMLDPNAGTASDLTPGFIGFSGFRFGHRTMDFVYPNGTSTQYYVVGKEYKETMLDGTLEGMLE